MPSEIKLRFSAAGLREIADALRATGQQGTAAFTAIAQASRDGTGTIHAEQLEIERMVAAFNELNQASSRSAKQLRNASQVQNPGATYGREALSRPSTTPIQAQIESART